jgi:hypothetical protein
MAKVIDGRMLMKNAVPVLLRRHRRCRQGEGDDDGANC